MKTKAVTRALRALALVLVGGPYLVVAQTAPFSHIRCNAVKDTLPKATYLVDEWFFNIGGTAGCSVKVPAKLFCIVTTTEKVDPPAPGPYNPDITLNVFAFFCYKQKCPKARITDTFVIEDQFGTHTFTKPQTLTSTLLCAPVRDALAGDGGQHLDPFRIRQDGATVHTGDR